MNILHVVRQFYPMIGGMENYVYHLANSQSKYDHQVKVLTLNKNYLTGEHLPSTETFENDIQVVRIPYVFSKKYPIAVKSFQHFKDTDLIIVHGVDFFMDFVSLTKRFHKKKIVLITHGGFFHTPFAKTFKKLFFNTITRFNIKKYDVVIGCSKNDMDQFKSIAPDIHLVNNGVNTEPFAKTKKLINGNNLIYIGRITKHKRVDNLIYLTAKLHEKGFPLNLKIVGPDWGNLTSELKGLAKKLNINENIIFEGPIDSDDLVLALSRSALFISASEYEGFGISAVEAMASGTYCVLNDIPSFRQLLTGKDFGKVVDFNDLEKVCDIIIDVLKLSDEEYLEHSQNAKEFAMQFNWINVAKKIELLIN